MSRQVDIKALISHIVRGDGSDKCRICMGDTSEGQVFLEDTVMLDGNRPVTLAELLATVTGVEVQPEDDLPSGLCSACTSSALDAANFRNFCHGAVNQWHETLILLSSFHVLDLKEKSKSVCAIVYDNKIKIFEDIHKPTDKNIELDGAYWKYECPECFKKFQTAMQLYSHLHRSSDLKRACFICGTVLYREQLCTHLETEHNIMPFQNYYPCKKCPALFMNHNSFVKHLIKLHTSCHFCFDCGCSFGTKSALSAHTKAHAIKSCPQCNMVFRNQPCYLQHIKMCLDIHRLTKGRQKIKSAFGIENIERRKVQDGLVGQNQECYCDYCGKKFKRKKFVQAHIQIVHLKNTHHPCPHCGQLQPAARMPTHIKKHFNTARFTCEFCDLVLRSRLGYIQHKRLHTGEKPYACKECDEIFSTSSGRAIHVRKIHKQSETVLKHTCTLCPAKFNLPYKLKKHLATVHEDEDQEPKFKCEICGEKFGSCRGLVHHSRKHQTLIASIESAKEFLTEVEISNVLPKQACAKCVNKAKMAVDFIQTCKDSERKWHQTTENLTITCDDSKFKTLFLIVSKNANVKTVTYKKSLETLEHQAVLACIKKRERQKTYSKRRIAAIKRLNAREFTSNIKCQFCKKTFLSPYYLNNHLKEMNIRVCGFCFDTVQMHDYSKHMLTCHGQKIYVCDCCHRCFRSSISRDKHKKGHSSGKYICSTCGRHCINERALYVHVASHASQKCLGCNKIFRSRSCFKYHRQSCTNNCIESYICDYCNKVFDKKVLLSSHIVVMHIRDYQHQCHHCGKKFLSDGHLREHLNSHKKVKDRFVCQLCGSKYSSRRGFERHCFKKHNFKPVTKRLTV